jgi:hypothetical protein
MLEPLKEEFWLFYGVTTPRGPSKKLAPTIGPDSGCPHSYSEDEGLQLEIDCSQCKGAHDLSNKKCLSAVLNVLSGGAQPEAIILKRFMHKRYRGDAVDDASAAASALASLNRAITSAPRPSDRTCRTCAASMDQLLNTIKRLLLEDPLLFVSDSSGLVARLREGVSHISCTDLGACLEAALKAAETRARVRG